MTVSGKRAVDVVRTPPQPRWRRDEQGHLGSSLTDRTEVILAHRRRASIARRRGWLVRRTLLVADVAGMAAAILTVALVGVASARFGLLVVFGLVLGKLYGLYDGDEEQANYTTVDDLLDVFHVFTVSSFLLLAVAVVFGGTPHVAAVVVLCAATMLYVTGARAVARAVVKKSIGYQQNVVIVGAGDVGQLIARKILQHPEYGMNLAGFVDPFPREPRTGLEELTILGSLDDLPDVVDRLEIDRVIFAFLDEANQNVLDLVRKLRDKSLQIDVVPRLFEAVGPNAHVHAIEGLPLMSLPSLRITRTSRWMKRTCDVVVSTCLLVVCSPLFAFIAYKVRRSSPGPVFFKQTRLGSDQRPFTMLKFRTMYVDTDGAAHQAYMRDAMADASSATRTGLHKLERTASVTATGVWLRRTSLDELPQLINVLRGNMSIVGPRPCLPYETEYFEPHHFERFLVPQGITGLWQVEGRGLMPPREAFDLDVAYARSWSLRLDLSLMLRTTSQVFRGDRAC